MEPQPGQDFYLLSKEHDWFVMSGPPKWAEARLSYRDESVFWEHAGNEDAVVAMGTMA